MKNVLRIINYHIRISKMLFIDYFAALFVKGKRNKVGLLIVKLDAIGDFVLWQSTAKALVDQLGFSPQDVSLVGNIQWKSLAEPLPYWRNCIFIDRDKFVSSLLYRAEILKRVRAIGCECAVQPTFSRELLYGDSIVRASDANTRIGYSGDMANRGLVDKWIGDGLYTKIIHESDNEISELRKIECFVNAVGRNKFSLKPITFDRHIVEYIGKRKPIVPGDRYAVIAPGAGFRGKKWPVMKYSLLVTKILDEFGLSIKILGDIGDRQDGDSISIVNTTKIANLAGKTELIDAVSIVKDAQFVVANDSSIIHIAAACNVPSICILGGGHYGRFLPYPENASNVMPRVVAKKMDCYGCYWRCVYNFDNPYPCIDAVSVDDVMKEIVQCVNAKHSMEKIDV